MKTILVDAVYCYVIQNGDGEFIIDQEMYELLESYPNPKIVLTGADDKGYKQYNLEQVSYPVFTLKHNPEKTNPEYYKILLEEFKLLAGEAVYFEHNIEAVKSAESVGIKSYLYNSSKRDLNALKSFLDQNL